MIINLTRDISKTKWFENLNITTPLLSEANRVVENV